MKIKTSKFQDSFFIIGSNKYNESTQHNVDALLDISSTGYTDEAQKGRVAIPLIY